MSNQNEHWRGEEADHHAEQDLLEAKYEKELQRIMEECDCTLMEAVNIYEDNLI